MSGMFGIDLGTTNSLIARLVEGRPVPIPIDGNPIVPSVVLYDGDRVTVGREARNLELQHPERSLRSVKRKMGTDHLFTVGERTLRPEEVSAEVLGALKRGAEAATGEPVREVVITVPAYFDDAQRRATLRAGELAGLSVLRLLNEPTSASLVYGQAGRAAATGEPELVLIYDLGGGTFDVSLLEVFGDVREVRATAGNTFLGGDDFDEKLVAHFLEHLRLRHGVDPRDDPRAMARLRRAAEATKISLSADTSARVREEFLATAKGQPVHLELEVTRREFEAMIAPLLESTIALCRKAVADANLTGQSVARICMVGGSTRIPRVRELLEEAFGAPVHEEVDVDLAVGLGAAVQAGLLAGAAVERILVDVTAHSLGIQVLGDEEELKFAPVIRRNSVLPAERVQEFYTLVDNQERVEVVVFQGDSPSVEDNTRIGSFNFELEPSPAQTALRVAFAYDLNGVVKVSVAQSGTKNAKTVSLAVADRQAPTEAGQGQRSLVVRKAERLLPSLSGEPRRALEALLERYAAARGEGKADAEDALLDFFLAHDTAEEP